MPVTIDEVTAEVAPPAADANQHQAPGPSPSVPERMLRQQQEMLEQLEQRALRLRAD